MNESGCIVTVEMKFRLHTDFLDRVLISQGIIQPGETRMDALLRVNAELEATADRLRKEAGPKEQPGFIGVIPTISKELERLEIDIDNAQTIDDLKLVKEATPAMPWPVLKLYNKKLEELSK